MRTHNGFPTIQIKDGCSDLDLDFVFVYIYNRAHYPHERVPGVYIKSWGRVFQHMPTHDISTHTIFFHKFSQIISFFSYMLLFFLIY